MHMSCRQNQLRSPNAKIKFARAGGPEGRRAFSLYSVVFKSTLNNAKTQRNWLHQNYQNQLHGPGQVAKCSCVFLLFVCLQISITLFFVSSKHGYSKRPMAESLWKKTLEKDTNPGYAWSKGPLSTNSYR